jgi:hypothetical protein
VVWGMDDVGRAWKFSGVRWRSEPLYFITKGFVEFEICPVNLFDVVLLEVFVKHTINAL